MPSISVYINKHDLLIWHSLADKSGFIRHCLAAVRECSPYVARLNEPLPRGSNKTVPSHRHLPPTETPPGFTQEKPYSIPYPTPDTARLYVKKKYLEKDPPHQEMVPSKKCAHGWENDCPLGCHNVV